MSNPDALPTVDIVYRGLTGGNAVSLRADGDEGNGATLTGHFSRFGVWYEINSWLEGHFIERTQLKSFAKTIADRDATIKRGGVDPVKVAFDHGFDPQIGDKPLGPIEILREENEGPYYEVPLLDTDYDRNFVLPALQGRTIDGRNLGSVLGSSFRFRVIGDEWNMEPGKSDHNPEGIPERTITEMRLFEFGPVVYPANDEATAGVRGLTDHFFQRALKTSGRSSRAVEALTPDLNTGAASGTPDTETIEPPEHSTDTPTRSAATLRMAMALIRP